jgi:hypothetical protein
MAVRPDHVLPCHQSTKAFLFFSRAGKADSDSEPPAFHHVILLVSHILSFRDFPQSYPLSAIGRSALSDNWPLSNSQSLPLLPGSPNGPLRRGLFTSIVLRRAPVNPDPPFTLMCPTISDNYVGLVETVRDGGSRAGNQAKREREGPGNGGQTR